MGVAIVLQAARAQACRLVSASAKGHACVEIDDRGVGGCFEVVTLPERNPVQLTIAPWLDEFFICILPIRIFDDGFGKRLGQIGELDPQLGECRVCGLGVGEDAEHFVRIVDLLLHQTPVGGLDFEEVTV